MKYVLFCSASLLLAQVVLAQGTPVPRYGNCPTGTDSQGGACVPRGNRQVFVNGDGPCPAGWTRSARVYCVR
jgi:hypothetical protein